MIVNNWVTKVGWRPLVVSVNCHGGSLTENPITAVAIVAVPPKPAARSIWPCSADHAPLLRVHREPAAASCFKLGLQREHLHQVGDQQHQRRQRGKRAEAWDDRAGGAD